MSNLAGWSPASHPFHKLLQVGDVIAAAAATFFQETYYIACRARTTEVSDPDRNESARSVSTRRHPIEIPAPVFESFEKYIRVRDSVLALMPEGKRYAQYFEQELCRDCVRYCAVLKSPESEYLDFCIESVFALFWLMPNECPLGENCTDADGNSTELRVARSSDEGRLNAYVQDGRVKILLMLAKLGEPDLPTGVCNRELRFRDWPYMPVPKEAELHEWIAAIRETKDAQAAPIGAGTQKREGDKPHINRGGRPPLKQLKNAQAQVNVYLLIRAAQSQGIRGPKTLMKHFKNNKDFRDCVKDAGLEIDLKMFRAAQKWITENPVHETHSRKV